MMPRMTSPDLNTLAQWGFEALQKVVAIDSSSDEKSTTIPSTEGQRNLSRVLAGPFGTCALDEMTGRSVGVELTDLGLRWNVRIGQRRIEHVGVEGEAEATVRGTANDLLLLAARLEDADTLFFHRRLQLTGDVELGLAVRNLLDQLPWEAIPLGLRVVLNRGARFARAARDAHRAA